MSEEKQYYAFISYNHADKKKARELQHWLEYYKLPTNLRKENPSLPKYVRPIFRDDTHLEIADLSPQIHEALEQSHYLIVVCSPNSAQSKWVNDEVEYFISLEKQDKIIPYIIEGVPYADDPLEECYPPALLQLSREKELLGANVNEVGKEAAGIRVVSKMFGIRYDTLYQRYQREQRHKRWIIITVILSVFLLLLSFIGYIVYSNLQLQDKNQQIDTKNIQLKEDAEILARHIIQIQNDSIMLVENNDCIQKQKDSIIQAMKLLIIEKKKMMENKGRYLSGEIIKLTKEGDIYTAQRIGAELYYNKAYLKDVYIPELENAIRNTFTAMSYHIDTTRSSLYPSEVRSKYFPMASFVENIRHIYDIKLSKDEKRIIILSVDYIYILDVHTGKMLKKIPIKDELGETWLSSDGAFLAYEEQNYIYVKNLETDEVCNTIMFPDQSIIESIDLLFHPNNDSIFWFNYAKGRLGVFDISTHCDINFNDEGLDLNTEKSTFMPRIFQCDKTGERVLLSPYCNTTTQNKLYVVDYKQEKIEVLPYEANYAIFYNNQIIISDKKQNIIFLHKVKDGKYILFDEIKVNGGDISNMLYSSDGKYLVYTENHNIRIWDMIERKPIQTIEGIGNVGYSVVFSKDGSSIFFGGDDYTVKKWSNENRIGTIEYNNRYLSLKSVQYDKSGKYLVAVDRDSVRIWDAKKRIELNRLRHKTDSTRKYYYATFSNKGQYVASLCSDTTIQIWDAKSWKFLGMIPCSTPINSVAFSQDDRLLATASADRYIRIWDVKSMQLIHVMNSHHLWVSSVAFSKDSDTLLSASAGAVLLWNIHNNQKRTLEMENIYDNVAFSPDEQYIIASDNYHNINMWDRKSGKVIHVFEGHLDHIRSAKFSPNGKYIVSSSKDGSVKVWSVGAGKEVMNYYLGADAYLHDAMFNSRGDKIVFVGEGKIQEIDFIPFEQIILNIQKQFKSNRLSPEERRKYFLE